MAAVLSGRIVTVARVWPEGDRTEEARLKKKVKRGYRKLCPICNEENT